MQISKIKNQKEVYHHQQLQIYKLLESVRHILWNRQEYLNVPTPDVTPILTLIEKCQDFEFKFRDLLFAELKKNVYQVSLSVRAL